jgi:hypothetical protein
MTSHAEAVAWAAGSLAAHLTICFFRRSRWSGRRQLFEHWDICAVVGVVNFVGMYLIVRNF